MNRICVSLLVLFCAYGLEVGDGSLINVFLQYTTTPISQLNTNYIENEFNVI